jgi:tRNA dimethylallyltransferase
MGQYLRGEIDRRTAIERYQQATRHFARRQWTWFRPDPRIIWLDAATATPNHVAKLLPTP